MRRVMVVDDHPLVRRGLRTLIAVEPDLAVCAEAAARLEGLRVFATSRPDLLVIGDDLADGSGLALVRDLRSGRADLPILVLGAHDTRASVERARRAGASGYLPKQAPTTTLLRTVRRLLAGGRSASPEG